MDNDYIDYRNATDGGSGGGGEGCLLIICGIIAFVFFISLFN